MPTFQARVEDLIGTIDDTSGLDQFCTDAAEEVLRILPEDLVKDKASRTYTTSSAGISVVGKRILSVSRGGYWAIKVDEKKRQKVTNSASLEYATARSPVYYIQVTATDARLYVKPDPASGAEADISHVTYPSIDASADSTNANLPTVAEELVVLGAARRVLQKRMADYMAEEDIELAQIQEREIDRLDAMFKSRLAVLMGTENHPEQRSPEGHL